MPLYGLPPMIRRVTRCDAMEVVGMHCTGVVSFSQICFYQFISGCFITPFRYLSGETVVRDRLIPNGSRSGDLDLQRGPRFTVGRGPVPRHATIAGDRPPRYGEKNGPSYRRAWALGCHTRMASGFPSPCNDRGGQAPALRKKTVPC